MKNKTKALCLIIFILTFIIVFQYINIKKNINNSFIISLPLLDELIKEKQENSLLHNYNKEDNKYVPIDKVQYIQCLGKYCIDNNEKDSIDKYLEIASFYMPLQFKNNSTLYENLYSDNKNQRMYSSKLLEYFILDGIVNEIENLYFHFDIYEVLISSNSQFKNDTLSLGENIECVISLGVNDFYNPIRIKIEGEEEITMDQLGVSVEYEKKATIRGENEIKGTVIYSSFGKESSFDFTRKYWVK